MTMGINFLGLTSGGVAQPQQEYKKGFLNGEVREFSKGSQSKVNTYASRSLFQNIEDLESRTAVHQGRFEGINTDENKVATVPIKNRGALWGEGFVVPANNGTGDLIPEVDNDKLRTIAMA